MLHFGLELGIVAGCYWEIYCLCCTAAVFFCICLISLLWLYGSRKFDWLNRETIPVKSRLLWNWLTFYDATEFLRNWGKNQSHQSVDIQTEEKNWIKDLRLESYAFVHIHSYKTNQKWSFVTSASLFLSPSPSSMAAACFINSIANQFVLTKMHNNLKVIFESDLS